MSYEETLHERLEKIRVLNVEIARKEALLTKLDGRLQPYFYEKKLSVAAESNLDRYRGPSSFDRFLGRDDVDAVIEELAGLRAYIVWLENENGHVDTNKDLMDKITELRTACWRLCNLASDSLGGMTAAGHYADVRRVMQEAGWDFEKNRWGTPGKAKNSEGSWGHLEGRYSGYWGHLPPEQIQGSVVSGLQYAPWMIEDVKGTDYTDENQSPTPGYTLSDVNPHEFPITGPTMKALTQNEARDLLGQPVHLPPDHIYPEESGE